MALPPGYQAPPPPAVKRSNSTVIWVVVIVAVAAFCIVLLLVAAAVLFPVFSQARYAAQTTACLSEIKQLNLAIQMYTVDNEGRYPSAEDWYTRAVAQGPKPRYQCPAVAKEQPSGVGFALNKELADLFDTSLEDPRQTVLVFESHDLGENVAGGAELMPNPGRHSGSNFGYADGSARRIRTPDSPGRWNP